jgi:heme oxygenase
MSLPDQLRTAISQLHQDIERTPLASAMMQSTLNRSTYAWWLYQIHSIHEVIESLVRELPFFEQLPLVRAMDRTKDAAADIAELNVSGCHYNESYVEQFLTDLESGAATKPWKLLGAVYVLEGSRMGSLMLAKPIARALGVPPQMNVGLNYHLEGAAERPRLWQMFRGSLAQLSLTTEQQAEVQEVAIATMSCLYEMYQNAPLSSPAAVAIGEA